MLLLEAIENYNIVIGYKQIEYTKPIKYIFLYTHGLTKCCLFQITSCFYCISYYYSLMSCPPHVLSPPARTRVWINALLTVIGYCHLA